MIPDSSVAEILLYYQNQFQHTSYQICCGIQHQHWNTNNNNSVSNLGQILLHAFFLPRRFLPEYVMFYPDLIGGK